MECPDEVFKDKVGAGNGTLPEVVGTVGEGATIEGVYPTLTSRTEESVTGVHLEKSIESSSWGIEPNVGIVEVSKHCFEIESEGCRCGYFVFIEIIGTSISKEACHIRCARWHVPSTFEIATSHDCRTQLNRFSDDTCS